MREHNSTKKHTLNPFSALWDLFCIATLVGIWPRFIEPSLIKTTSLDLKIPLLPVGLEGFKILQISDLHISKNTSDRFLNRLANQCRKKKPDMIVVTGDFISYSSLEVPSKLKDFLSSLKAPYGQYAVLGNHDYSSFVSINNDGDYDTQSTEASSLYRAFKRLATKTKEVTGKVTERARAVHIHQDLVDLIQSSGLTLLHNQNIVLPVKNTFLNICGLGELMTGKMDPQTAYAQYDRQFPGIVLVHNPDAITHLDKYPGDLFLSGHTHGGQVNLPWFWKKFTLLENPEFKGGYVSYNGRQLYVNRGIGSVLPFRWFASPEITLFTLRNTNEKQS